MTAGLRALLAGVIDYAGLFPPAKLPLDRAIRNYARYRAEPESWMLGRFIVPAARLAELTPFVEELFREGPPLVLSVLGRGGNSAEGQVAGLKADLAAVTAFRERHGARAVVDVLEVKMAAVFPAVEPGPAAMSVYVEAAPVSDWRGETARVVGLLGRDRQSHAPAGRMGYKLRCGGLEAAAFPSPEQVAFTIATCRDAGVPLKCTAGLHHPVRHYDSGVMAVMHGFLNVFGGGVLADARRLGEDQLRRAIEEEDPGAFHFDDDGFGWRDVRASAAEVAAARGRLMVSFGSCSFDEPRDDLRAMRLLP